MGLGSRVSGFCCKISGLVQGCRLHEGEYFVFWVWTFWAQGLRCSDPDTLNLSTRVSGEGGGDLVGLMTTSEILRGVIHKQGVAIACK